MHGAKRKTPPVSRRGFSIYLTLNVWM